MTQYSGKIIRKNPVTPTQQFASGVWTTADAAAAVKNNNWPVAGVPNPISRSLRFRASASAYLNRTPASAGDRKLFTWSGWVKGSFADPMGLFAARSDATNGTEIRFTTNGALLVSNVIAGTSNGLHTTAALYRDPSAWYHVVVAVDTANATAANRFLIYVNGVLQTVTITTAVVNANTFINSTVAHYIGDNRTVNGKFDGYMTEVNFVDGQALTPSSFGTTDSTTGAWIPMPYTGTYGTNGYYLNFKDNTSTTTLGADYSGNSNNWTASAISLTAGTTYDSMVDVPTPWSAYNTAGDVGATVRGNYCTPSPIDQTGTTMSNGNLALTFPAGTNSGRCTMSASSGKYYFEVTQTAASTSPGNTQFGVLKLPVTGANAFTSADSWSIYSGLGTYNNNVFLTSGVTPTIPFVMQIAFDIDAGKIWFGINNTWLGSGNPSANTNPRYSNLGSGEFMPYWSDGASVETGSASFNFGQRPFAYTPPTGFKTLNTFNLPNPSIKNGASYMAATLYTGNATARTIDNSVNGVSFQPDWVWIKSRSATTNNQLVDAVRGTSLGLSSNLTSAEYGVGVNAFASNGFGLTTDGSLLGVNVNAATYVAWQWKAGGTAVSNTAGSITSSVSANTTAGFSVVTWTGNGSNINVGHGLGVAPNMIIIKSKSAVSDWYVYHSSIGTGKYILLDTTAATVTNANYFTASTSTVFSATSAATGINTSAATYVAYCFAAVAGYSAFGSYTGNGSTDGPFVFTGFRPKFVMLKITSTTGNWFIQDSSTNTSNTVTNYLYADSSAAEATNGLIDFLSNGFKLRNTYATQNPSGGTIIYVAFAENPFKYSNAR